MSDFDSNHFHQRHSGWRSFRRTCALSLRTDKRVVLIGKNDMIRQMNKALKRGLLVITVLLLIMGGALGFHYYLLDRSYQERLKGYENTYAEEIPRLVAGPVSPEVQADVHAFISYSFLNDALNTLVGPEWRLSPSNAFTLSRLHFASEHGTPLLELVGRLHLGSGNSIDIKGVATLTPLCNNSEVQ